MLYYEIFSLAENMSAIMLSVFGLILLRVLGEYEKWVKLFISVWFCLIIVIEASLIIQYTSGFYNNVSLYRCFDFINYSVQAFMYVFLTAGLLRYSGENLRKSPLLITVSALWTAYFVFLLVNLFSGIGYGIDENCETVRGKLFWLFIVLAEAPLFPTVFGFIKRRKHFSKWQIITGLLYIIMPPSIIVVIFEGILIVFIIKENLKKKDEIANQKASIAVLQMRPHFIFNALSSIHFLEGKDPEKAQQVTMDFMTYLRHNFSAIAEKGTIPFNEELQHTKAYLDIEKAAYEDDLTVEFNTPFTNFRLPPLTLQPIVENSIKHGMPNDERGLTVSVSTEETEKGVIITVKDNGIGFSENDNDEPHIALANIKERLEMMCKGTLKFDSTEDKGTTVTIFVPIKK